MRLAIFLSVIAVVPASAQLGTTRPASPAAVTAKAAGAAGTSTRSAVPTQNIGTLEKELDGRLAATGATTNDPCIVLGNTRGLAISGFGAVFTSEVELVLTPSLSPFTTSISPEQKAQIHKRKLAHIAPLQQTMRDMVLSLAASPILKLADTDQIVVSVRLIYRPWEDTKDLPGQLVMRLDRRGGTPKLEVQ